VITAIQSGFWFKISAAVLLVVTADILVFDTIPGSVLGVFCLLWLVLAASVRKGWRGDRRGQWAALAALAMSAVMIDRPSLLAWILFGIALMVAMQSARVRPHEDAWRWAQRLIVNVLGAFIAPALDLRTLSRAKTRKGAGVAPARVLHFLVVPVIGAVVFIGLFSMANPLLADFISRLSVPRPGENQIARVIFWGIVLIGTYGVFRPRWRRKLIALPHRSSDTSFIPAASVMASLVVFNLIFAVQNGLDLAFLWSGASLPAEITLAEYAHRGAYPLIFTALLAGLFVLVFLHPGSTTANNPWIRRLVVLWVGQNLLLVASSLLRTAEYIDVYSLTRLRLSAMIWMVLVAVGLCLICWRLLKNRSGSWLINTNVAACAIVLFTAATIDLGPIVAAWNTTHAREAGGHGQPLDLPYLMTLGGASVLSLARMEQRTGDPAFKATVRPMLDDRIFSLTQRQADWRSWRWRDARRLSRLRSIRPDALAARPCPSPACDTDWIRT